MLPRQTRRSLLVSRNRIALPGEIATNVPVDAFNPFNPFNQIISGGSRARLAEFGNRLFDNTAMPG